MYSTEERLAALHRRAAELQKEKKRRRIRLVQTLSVTLCFALTIATAFIIPGFSDQITADTEPMSMSASIFTDNGALGYIVIGTIAFLLGIAVTIFCFRLKDRQAEDGKKQGDKHD